MAKPTKFSNRAPNRAIGNHVEQFRHHASERLSSEVEKIVYKVMTNPGLENTISSSIQKGLIALIVRYWLWIGLGMLGFLIAHTVILTLILVIILRSVK